MNWLIAVSLIGLILLAFSLTDRLIAIRKTRPPSELETLVADIVAMLPKGYSLSMKYGEGGYAMVVPPCSCQQYIHSYRSDMHSRLEDLRDQLKKAPREIRLAHSGHVA